MKKWIVGILSLFMVLTISTFGFSQEYFPPPRDGSGIIGGRAGEAWGLGIFHQFTLHELSAAPTGDPVDNTGWIYGKNVGGVTHPFWQDKDGTETDLLSGATPTAWDAVTDPTGNASITLSTYTNVFTGAAIAANQNQFLNTGNMGDVAIVYIQQLTGIPTDGKLLYGTTASTKVDGIQIYNSTADITETNALVRLDYLDNADTDGYFIIGRHNNSATTSFSVDMVGNIVGTKITLASTVLDVNSLDFVGAGEITSAAGTAITINPNAGNVAGEDLIITAHNIQLTATGAITMSPDAAETTAIIITDTDYTNSLSIGDNNIIGTSFSITGTTAVIDFTDFDVSADGLITLAPDDGGTGITITPSAALTTGLDVSSASITNGVNLGATKLLGTTAVIDFTSFDVNGTGDVTAHDVTVNGALSVIGSIKQDAIIPASAAPSGITLNAATTGEIAIGNISTGAIRLGVSTGATEVNIPSGVYLSFGADPADTGAIRLSNANYIYAEASAAGTDISVIGVDSSEIIQIGPSGASAVTITPATTITGILTMSSNPRIYDGDSNYVSLDAPNIAADITVILPSTAGTLMLTTGSPAAMVIASQAIGDLLYADSGTTWARLPDVAAGQPLLSGGIGVIPAYAGYTFSATAAQTYTFPTTTATLARTDAAQSFTGTQTFAVIVIPESTPVNAVASQGTITMAGIAVAEETFVISTQTFTWKALRSGAGEVTIGADAPAAVTNIVTAVTADLATVTAADGAGDTVVVTAATKGVAGNSIVFTEASTNMTVDGTGTLGATTAGVNGTVGVANEIRADASYLYHAILANTISDNNWRRIALGSSY